MDMELAIIGAGSAGYAAGIYAGRAGIDAVIFDSGMGGGQGGNRCGYIRFGHGWGACDRVARNRELSRI